MIRSFQHRGLEKFYKTGSKAGIQPHHAAKLRGQLTVLNQATKPADIAKSGWGLHSLRGELQGFWSIWFNGNWRLTFRFSGEDVEIVDYQDYH